MAVWLPFARDYATVLGWLRVRRGGISGAAGAVVGVGPSPAGGACGWLLSVRRGQRPAAVRGQVAGLEVWRRVRADGLFHPVVVGGYVAADGAARSARCFQVMRRRLAAAPDTEDVLFVVEGDLFDEDVAWVVL